MRKGNTGKRFLTAVAIASLSLTLAACAGGESGQKQFGGDRGAEAVESAEIKDEAAAEETDQETQEQAGNPVTIYRGNDTVERMLMEEVRLRKLRRRTWPGS